MPRSSAVTRRVNAERLVLIGWLRALLLQLSHPLLAAGVTAHSTFRGSTAAAFSRLRHTVGAMLAITFGDAEECERALDGIRAIHRRVHGTLPMTVGPFAAGTPYSAEDSDLLIWVHATLVESIVLVYERLVAPLTPEERDRCCADGADVAVALGADAGAVPRSWAALRDYLDGMYASGRLVVGPQARTAGDMLLAPLPFRFVNGIVRPVTSLLVGTYLPPAIRSQYGLRWGRRHARWSTRLMSTIRLIRRIAPRRLALWRHARSFDCYGVHHGYSTAAR